MNGRVFAFIIPLKCADALRGVLSSDGRGRGDGAGGDCAMGNGSGYVCTWIEGCVICRILWELYV